ncbi:MAG: hypothetical protein JKY60_18715 [Kordiimonadaceae bacterium]|nr:hypothetical protein [Kordiimonadaceae bacterium]
MFSLLILGTEDDPHVSYVKEKLLKLNHEVCVLDHNKPTDFHIHQESNGKITFKINGYTWDQDYKEFIIWNRQKLWWGSPFFFGKDYEHQADYNSSEELRTSLYLGGEWRGLYHAVLSIFEGQVVNNPVNAWRSNKLFQQGLASSVGFKVADSILTNQKDKILSFARNHDPVIMKSFSGTRLRPKKEENQVPYTMMTMDVSRNEIEQASSEQFLSGPCFIQRKIAKSYELRVVMVGEDTFPFKINSQEYQHTKTDWRHGNLNIPFIYTILPDEIVSKAKAFMKSVGLVTGSIDLIVDEDGVYWFLEVNPTGAWAWLDHVIDGKISDAFSAYFIHCIERLNSSIRKKVCL